MGKIPAVSGWSLPQQAVSASEAITISWLGVLGGYGNGSSANANGNGYYWSSTWNSTTNAYILNFNSGGVWPQNNNNKYNGQAVRCVKKSEERVKRLKSGRVERGVGVGKESGSIGMEFAVAGGLRERSDY